MSSQAPAPTSTRTTMVIEHRTTITYERPVTASYNEVRMRPLTLPGQTVLETDIAADPCTFRSEYRDYFGTAVLSFEALAPHTELGVLARARVELSPLQGRSGGAGWETLRAPDLQDRMTEFLMSTPTTRIPEDLQALATDAAATAAPAAAAEAVCLALREQMEYVTGVTGVHTWAAEAWAERKGVCQDLAHLAAGALRHLGIPTRYVSGYLHPSAETARVGETVAAESHAWVEYWCGDWFGFDPTNSIPTGPHHVIVGRGREYDDVAPLRGVVAGGGASRQQVQVDITIEG
ncbi:transglutaminase family protein [Pseudactinotalea sp. Z1748]|uniref:transglutaminase family protein n=1 Tax=Pseudactinotalea sp. Z1748 TaxID=3413027 RepID=UPI003C7C8B83